MSEWINDTVAKKKKIMSRYAALTSKKKKKKANIFSTVDKSSFGPQTEDDLKALSKKAVVHLSITN